jgi:Zn-dependent protease
MRWSWKLGNVFGIGVHMHATFLILLGWVMLSHWMQGHSVGVMLAGVGFILALFSCVLLHEFGHAVRHRSMGPTPVTLPSKPKSFTLLANLKPLPSWRKRRPLWGKNPLPFNFGICKR